MRIKSTVSMGFQCPVCGNVQQQTLSAFALMRVPAEICCSSCKKPYAAVFRSAKGMYTITAACLDCFAQHRYQVKSAELWFAQRKEFDCPHSGDVIFLIGQPEPVAQALKELFVPEGTSIDAAMEELVMQAGHTNAAALAEAIRHITDLSAQEKIVCACGEIYIQLELTEDALLLCCPSCGRRLLLDVSDEAHINQVKKMKSIKIK